ncbi:HlyD family efflux transporter periplasmic adaptor subunit [Sulfitobacter sp. S223]|uniref:HlyD family efflux transporter periplasmic adaptor subunit n=1 Tax=Sulfitobacter sp. S223 TaxID=2867023 RepID=UPI0021A5A090|nr:HlyD family efflux transporter periplasmic adaptor subunit [Sulfitobacter sp. S223]UWR27342.1 HlyD family efflux transporter periplasmic adaptor subunit [Sulfitobacter sp. S223]
MASSAEFKKVAGRGQKRIIVTITVVVIAFLLWASGSTLDEVAIGSGRVIPSSQKQLVQSVQGGRVVQLLVAEGDVVAEGQLLAVLDTTRIEAEREEIQAGLNDARAQQQLLTTLLQDKSTLSLSEDLRQEEDLVRQKTALFNEMRFSHTQNVSDLEGERALLLQEQEIFQRASALGGSTEIERLRLQQKIASIETDLNNLRQSYKSDLQIQLDEVNRTAIQLNIRLAAQRELLVGNELRSPRRGVVQEILVSTAGGGVLPPNGTVMEIVPIEDRLLIEARFSPRDIAFIAPDQIARIKVTAYDFSIYGDLEARVLRVSPDSFQDELQKGEYYFAVTLESERTFFTTPDGKELSIIPGMTTSTEILTGSRTVLQYLLKPLNKAAEALRER